MTIIDKLGCADSWEEFYEYKCSLGHIPDSILADLRKYIDGKEYETVVSSIKAGKAFPLPLLREINKKGTDKKRKVFVFSRKENYVLKLVAYLLHEKEHIFSGNLYSFRRGVGVKQAIDYITARRDRKSVV